MMKNKNNIPENLPDYFFELNDLSKELAVCHEMASKMHAKHLRHKDGYSLPYMAHINTAYTLLKESGVTDETALGACLLHDVIEDYTQEVEKTDEDGNVTVHKERILDDLKLKNLLEYQLLNAGTEHNYARIFSEEVVNAVMEVTDEGKFETKNAKRYEQTSEIRHSSNTAKLIKTADQAASMLEDIVCVSKKMTDKDVRDFSYKARDAIEAANEPRPINDKLYGVARVIWRYNQHTYNIPKDNMIDDTTNTRESLREGFSLDEAFRLATFYERPQKNITQLEQTISYAKDTDVGENIRKIYFNDQGKVGAYCIRNDGSERKQAGNSLHEHIEWDHLEGNSVLTNELMRIVRTGVTQKFGDARYVTMHILPPMDAEEFKAVTERYAPLDKRMEEEWKSRPQPNAMRERL